MGSTTLEQAAGAGGAAWAPALERLATEAAAAARCEVETVQARSHRNSCALLLERILDIDMQHWPNFGVGELEIIPAILGRPVIE